MREAVVGVDHLPNNISTTISTGSRGYNTRSINGRSVVSRGSINSSNSHGIKYRIAQYNKHTNRKQTKKIGKNKLLKRIESWKGNNNNNNNNNTRRNNNSIHSYNQEYWTESNFNSNETNMNNTYNA